MAINTPLAFAALLCLNCVWCATFATFSTKLRKIGGSNTRILGNRRLRGGSDLHTGKFVIEHRRSNNSNHEMMQRQTSSIASLDDLYDVHGVLGEGGFATVRKGIHRITKNVYAIKTIDLCKIRVDQLDSLRNEVNIMKMLDHPNVVKLYETFEEENKLHLVLELCEGGDLFEFIMKTSIESGQKTWSDGSVYLL
jgi:serine/threonine protein kinase